MFHCIQVQLACAKCMAEGKTASCQHMLHLMPRWQSSERMIRLQTIMSDRPDLIESELSGVAANTLQSAFRASDIDMMFQQAALPDLHAEPIFIFIDPACGGPQSDYAVLTIVRRKGMVQVTPCPTLAQPCQLRRYTLFVSSRSDSMSLKSFRCHVGTTSFDSTKKKFGAFPFTMGAICHCGTPSQTSAFICTLTFNKSRKTARAAFKLSMERRCSRSRTKCLPPCPDCL
jgi:hypothetical protein